MIIPPSSEKRLRSVHPDLVRVVRRCAADWTDQTFTWIVTCGPRTLEEQKLMVKKGASRTLRSRHIPAPNGHAHAVDVAPVLDGKVRWDWPYFHIIAAAMKKAAAKEKVPLEWGGDWRSFKDGPHFQLPWKSHPGTNPKKELWKWK